MKKQNKIYEEDGIVHYYGNPAGYVQGDKVLIDAIFYKEDLLAYIKNVMQKPVEVQETLHQELCESEAAAVKEQMRKLGIRIFQLHKDSPILERFVSLYAREDNGFGKPHREEYDLIYEGEGEGFNLEDIWDCFGRRCPNDFDGHPLSISDIVELSDGEKSRFFYIEPSGFTEITF